jgi:hypothetical protein
MTNPQHGVDGWGLETYTRDIETYDNGDGTTTIVEIGYAAYEKTKPYKKQNVVRVLGRRTVPNVKQTPRAEVGQ